MSERIYRNIIQVAKKIFLPLLLICIVPVFILITSVLINFYIRSIYLPKTSLHEPIYFNFLKSLPKARIEFCDVSLNQNECLHDQCRLNTCPIHSLGRGKVLKSGYVYDISIEMLVASSIETNELPTSVMISVTLLDSSSKSIAKSLRPFSLKPQSKMSLWLDGIFLYPLRVYGYNFFHQFSNVRINAFDSYMETYSDYPQTKSIEIELSSKSIVIENSYISIQAKPYGFSYFLYYYPLISSLVIIALSSSILCGFLVIIGIVSSITLN